MLFLQEGGKYSNVKQIWLVTPPPVPKYPPIVRSPRYVNAEQCRLVLVGVSQWANVAHVKPVGGGVTPRVLGRQPPPPPSLVASGQLSVAKGAALRSPWAPKFGGSCSA